MKAISPQINFGLTLCLSLSDLIKTGSMTRFSDFPAHMRPEIHAHKYIDVSQGAQTYESGISRDFV